jgi:putative endonuclease
MTFYVYILTNVACTVLYVGVTRDLILRVWQHKEGHVAGFTKRYNVNRLVYYEEYPSAYDAITREKLLKAGSRRKKMELIDGFNPTWRDLYHEIVSETP